MKDNLRWVPLKDLISAVIPIEKFFRTDLFLLRSTVPRLSPNRRTNRSIDGLDSRLVADWWISTVHQRSKRNPLVYHPPFCFYRSIDACLFSPDRCSIFLRQLRVSVSRSDPRNSRAFHTPHLYFRRSLILLRKIRIESIVRSTFANNISVLTLFIASLLRRKEI